MLHIRPHAVILVIAALGVSSSAEAQQTVAADRFVDSAGVNIHLHYDRTIYATEFPLIKSRLLELGVRHVRDGLVDSTWWVYYDRHNELGRAGIKGLFIARPTDSAQLLAEFPSRMRDSFEAYEAPNEYDRSNDANWVQTMKQILTRLRSMRNVPAVAHFPIFGPSLVDEGSYAELGNVSHLFDAGNLHNYLGGRNPETPGWGSNGYGSIAWNLNLARRYAGGKPIITTETGYMSNMADIQGIPQQVAGRYLPRVLLEQFRAGIPRTYVYELADHPTSRSYGLLNADGSPKPTFTAMKHLLNLLADPGPAFTPQNLGYSVQGGSSDLRQMVFQKRNGTYFLALWLGLPGYDVDSRQTITVPPQRVTVSTTSPMRVTRTHKWQPNGSMTTTTHAALLPTHTTSVDVSDALTVIELAPPLLSSLLPGIPLGLTAAVQDRNVSLRWQSPSTGGAPTSFTIDAATSLTLANPVSVSVGAATELTVPDVPPGVYFVRIRAANGHGHGEASNIVQFIVGLPEAPQLVALRTSTNPIALTWSGSDGDHQYVLSAGTSPGASDVAVVPMGNVTQVTAPVPPGVQYFIRVAAVNEYGAARSNEVSVAVGGRPQQPGAPTLQAQVNGRRVSLSWAPGAGGGADNYVVVVGTSPGAANVGVFPVGLTTQVAGDSPVAATLYVRVFAQNSVGTAPSNEITLSIR